MAKFYVVDFGQNSATEVYMTKSEAIKEAKGSGYSYNIRMMEIPVTAESIKLMLENRPYATEIKTIAFG